MTKTATGVNRKIGPLPLWTWAIVAAGAAYVAYRFLNRDTGSGQLAGVGATYPYGASSGGGAGGLGGYAGGLPAAGLDTGRPAHGGGGGRPQIPANPIPSTTPRPDVPANPIPATTPRPSVPDNPYVDRIPDALQPPPATARPAVPEPPPASVGRPTMPDVNGMAPTAVVPAATDPVPVYETDLGSGSSDTPAVVTVGDSRNVGSFGGGTGNVRQIGGAPSAPALEPVTPAPVPRPGTPEPPPPVTRARIPVAA